MQINYTTINHVARQQLGLSLNEYCLVDLIYNLSNNPSNKMLGWCYASKTTLGEMLGLSEQSIHALLRKLETKKLVIKNPVTKHLKVKQDWYDMVIIKNTKESLATLKKVEPETKESLVRHTKESLDNKDIYNKDNTKIVAKATTSFGNEDINLIMKKLYDYLEVKPLRVKQQRWATQRLLKRYGLERSLGLVDAQIWLVENDQYAYKVNSIEDLWNKQNDILLAIKKQKSNQLTRI